MLVPEEGSRQVEKNINIKKKKRIVGGLEMHWMREGMVVPDGYGGSCLQG